MKDARSVTKAFRVLKKAGIPSVISDHFYNAGSCLSIYTFDDFDTSMLKEKKQSLDLTKGESFNHCLRGRLIYCIGLEMMNNHTYESISDVLSTTSGKKAVIANLKRFGSARIAKALVEYFSTHFDELIK